MKQQHPDTKRFDWFFGSKDKYPFLDAYMQGVREGWTVDQWREAIDRQMEQEN